MTDPRVRTDPEKAETNWLLRTHANYTYGTKVENRESRRKYYKRYTCVPNCDSNNGGPPYFTALILIICWVCFYIYNLSDDSISALINSWMIYFPDNVNKNYEFWRLFTYSFLHADLTHIASNCFILLIVGSMLELGHDSFRPAIIYCVGCIFGSLLSGIVAPGVYLVGASGGCYALVFAHLGNLIINGDIMDKKALLVRAVFILPLVCTVIFDTWQAMSRFGQHDFAGTGVSWSAHAGGAFVGLFFGIYVLRNYEVMKHERICKWISICVFGAGTVSLFILTIADMLKDPVVGISSSKTNQD